MEKPLEGLSSASFFMGHVSLTSFIPTEVEDPLAEKKVFNAKLCGHITAMPESIRCVSCERERRLNIRKHPKDIGAVQVPKRFSKWHF